MSCLGYGSPLSSPTLNLFSQGRITVEVPSSLQRKAPPSLMACSFCWGLVHQDLSFRLFFATVSWLFMPVRLSWTFQPDLNVPRVDSEAGVLFWVFAILWVCCVSCYPHRIILSLLILSFIICLHWSYLWNLIDTYPIFLIGCVFILITLPSALALVPASLVRLSWNPLAHF